MLLHCSLDLFSFIKTGQHVNWWATTESRKGKSNNNGATVHRQNKWAGLPMSGHDNVERGTDRSLTINIPRSFRVSIVTSVVNEQCKRKKRIKNARSGSRQSICPTISSGTQACSNVCTARYSYFALCCGTTTTNQVPTWLWTTLKRAPYVEQAGTQSKWTSQAFITRVVRRTRYKLLKITEVLGEDETCAGQIQWGRYFIIISFFVRWF